MSEFWSEAWWYLKGALSFVGFFGSVFVALIGALFGGVVFWPVWGWWSVMASLTWLVLWLALSGFFWDMHP